MPVVLCGVGLRERKYKNHCVNVLIKDENKCVYTSVLHLHFFKTVICRNSNTIVNVKRQLNFGLVVYKLPDIHYPLFPCLLCQQLSYQYMCCILPTYDNVTKRIILIIIFNHQINHSFSGYQDRCLTFTFHTTHILEMSNGKRDV